MPPRRDLEHWVPNPVHAVNYATAALSGVHLANAALSLLVGVPAIETNCQYFASLVRPEHSFIIRLDDTARRCDVCEGEK